MSLNSPRLPNSRISELIRAAISDNNADSDCPTDRGLEHEEYPKTDLMIDTLVMAKWRRKPGGKVLIHSG